MNNAQPYPAVLPFSFPGIPGVRCLFTTALAGDMSFDGGGDTGGAEENRRRLMRLAGFSRWAEVYQVHGDALVPAKGRPDPDRAGTADADGHYTFDRGVGLIVKTGDCQPILIARTDSGAAAAIHVGWRGNAMNFPGTAVDRLCQAFSCRPDELAAVRGPSLGPAAAEFINFSREWPPEFQPWYDPERRTVDLWGLTRSQLHAAGVPEAQIFSLDLCTKTMEDVFFSHRRKDRGRQVGVIWLAP